MPINIKEGLPAQRILEEENVFVMTENRALHQDIRPLKIVLLNLMPTKITTETQILRLVGNTPLQVDVEFIRTDSYKAKNISEEHMSTFYKGFNEVKANKYDGLIITGAPVELMPFEQVDYWQELCEIMEWSKTNVTSTFHICWGAQAGLYYHYGIQKHELPAKMFGVFEHTTFKSHEMLLRGFDETFFAPHSRHTEVTAADIHRCPDVTLLAESRDAGVYLTISNDRRFIFVMGHSEYDAYTLHGEYIRDLDKGLNTAPPANYYYEQSEIPCVRWRSHANLLYTNWLNYYVYQTTPYDIAKVGV